MKIHIDEMILYKGDPSLKFGLAAAYNNHLEGRPTKSEGKPIVVRYVMQEKKYVVLDGYHRIINGLLEGNLEFDCGYDWFGEHSKRFWIPEQKDRFVLTGVK